MDIQIIPTMAPIDRTIVHFEPESSRFLFRVPTKPSTTFQSNLDTHIAYSDSAMKVDLSQNDEVIVKGTAPQGMFSMGTTLFTYNNKYCEKLLSTTRVEVMSRTVVYCKTILGEEARLNLTIPARNAR